MSTTNESRREKDLAEIDALAKELHDQMAIKDHKVALTALLSVYVELAASNPCCTQGCANNAMQAAMLLAKCVAQGSANLH